LSIVLPLVLIPPECFGKGRDRRETQRTEGWVYPPCERAGGAEVKPQKALIGVPFGSCGAAKFIGDFFNALKEFFHALFFVL
jgi:hypothetical protein